VIENKRSTTWLEANGDGLARVSLTGWLVTTRVTVSEDEWAGSGVRQPGTVALLAIVVSAAPGARVFTFQGPSPSGLGSRFAGRPSPGFPVELGGFGGLYAPFFMERRTRGSLQCNVAGNPGPGLEMPA
jgi:hypothetical protein